MVLSLPIEGRPEGHFHPYFRTNPVSIPVFFLLFGLLLLISPNFIIGRHGDDPEDAVMNWMMNTDINKVMLVRAMSISGICFLFFGAALLVLI